MTVFAVFFVVAFWAFVLCELCVLVAAVRCDGDWLEVVLYGTGGALWVAIWSAFFVVVVYAIFLAHGVLFGGGV